MILPPLSKEIACVTPAAVCALVRVFFEIQSFQDSKKFYVL